MADEKDETTQKDMNSAIKDAEKALADAEKETEDTSADESEEKTEDTAEDDGKDEEEDELDETQLVHAKNLFKLLNNPATAKSTLETLVKAAGLEQDATKSEKKAVAKTVKELIKEGLGEDYAFLSEKLGATLENALDSIFESKIKGIKDQVEAASQAQARKDVDAAQAEVLAQYTEVPDKVMREANRIIQNQELIPGPNSTHKQFFNILLKTAADNLEVNLIRKGSSSNSNKQEEKRARNRADVNSRQTSGARPEKEKVVNAKSLNDAVGKADEQVRALLGIEK